jgi:hypothetical protein
MITSPQKIQAVARDLGNRLAIRFQNNAGLNTVRYAMDANGGPQLFFSHNGNEAEGQPVVLVWLSQISMQSNDIFGNPELAYTPSLSQVAYELNTTGGSFATAQDILTIEWELIPYGIAQQLVQIANGTPVTAAAVTAAAPTAPAVLDNLYWPTKGA